MGVEAKVQQIVRKASGWHSSFVIEFVPESGDPDEALEAMREAVDVANNAASTQWQGDSGIAMAGSIVMRGPKGPIVYCGIADTPTAVRGWLDVLVEELERRGWSGALGTARESWPKSYGYGKRVPCVSLVATVERWEQPATPPPPGTPLVWNPPADLQAALVDWAFDLITDPRPFLSHDVSCFRLSREDARALLVDLNDTTLVSEDARAGTASSVDFTRYGRASFQTADPGRPWHDLLDDVMHALDGIKEHASNAIVRIAYGPGFGAETIVWGLHPPRPAGTHHRDSPDIRFSRFRDLDDWVPDAYGIQLVKNHILDRANDLTNWDITPLPGDKSLVVARDLAAWFEHDQPTSGTLERARQDFGDMILELLPPRPTR